MKQQQEEEVKFCETHKVWYTKDMPCKACKEPKSKQEKSK